MSVFVGLFGAFVAVLGVVGALAPVRLLDLVTRVQTRAGLWGMALLRVVLAVALWLAAPASQAPAYLQVLAVLSLLSGLATPFFGLARFAAVVDWWRRRADWQVRLWSLLVVAFGASLVWAVA
ncbi:MAG: hypothetical protein ACQGVC_06060 [Myxococcota bacterium]